MLDIYQVYSSSGGGGGGHDHGHGGGGHGHDIYQVYSSRAIQTIDLLDSRKAAEYSTTKQYEEYLILYICHVSIEQKILCYFGRKTNLLGFVLRPIVNFHCLFNIRNNHINVSP